MPLKDDFMFCLKAYKKELSAIFWSYDKYCRLGSRFIQCLCIESTNVIGWNLYSLRACVIMNKQKYYAGIHTLKDLFCETVSYCILFTGTNIKDIVNKGCLILCAIQNRGEGGVNLCDWFGSSYLLFVNLYYTIYLPSVSWLFFLPFLYIARH